MVRSAVELRTKVHRTDEDRQSTFGEQKIKWKDNIKMYYKNYYRVFRPRTNVLNIYLEGS
jgi:hypothetical protein